MESKWCHLAKWQVKLIKLFAIIIVKKYLINNTFFTKLLPSFGATEMKKLIKKINIKEIGSKNNNLTN